MKTTGNNLRANPSVSDRHREDAILTPHPPNHSDSLGQARALLFLVAALVVLPIVYMTGDHLLRQKPAVRHQQAVFRAAGLSAPCIFPAGHPARTGFDTSQVVDWRLTPAMPQAAPGTDGLVRPRAAPWRGTDHDR
ncbi:MAG: hypothetical protein QNJ04_09160 [Desulfobacterales bacterium]|nr:hypothetical protein [Desulfobacterales bacterium]